MSSFTRGPANVDDLLATTLDHYRDQIQETWKTATPLMKKLMDTALDISGGNDIVEHIEFASNPTSGFASKTATVSTAIPQIATDARWGWSWLPGTIGIYDYEEAQNKGKDAMLNLLELRIQNLQDSMRVDFETGLGASSTATANDVWSLVDIIDSSNPTLANYGDIDRSTYSMWQATETASGSMATQGLEDIRTAHLTTSRDLMDPVNVMVTTPTLYNAYNGRLQSHEKLVSGDKGDLEFQHLAFHNIPVFPASSLTSGLWLGFNTKYLQLYINSNLKFKQQPFVRAPGGQSKSALIQLESQLICRRPSSNFKLTGMVA